MAQRLSRRAPLVAVSLLALIVAFSSGGDSVSAQQPGERLSTPPPGAWTVGFAWSDSFSTLLATIPFEATSIAIFDNDSEEFTVYIPGAPERVNAEASALLDEGSIIWVKRAPSGVVGPPLEDCDAVPSSVLGLLDERVGFGANATGGAAGCIYHVTNDNNDGPGSLREGARIGNRWIVFDGSFTIELDGNIRVAGNTTIDGRGRRVEIVGSGLHMEGASSSNVIINDVVVRDVRFGNTDLLAARRGATNFWFHHLALVGATDEYIDVSQASAGGAEGTISWTHFQRGGGDTNELVILLGDEGGLQTNHLIRITVHHNWFEGTRQRHPLVTGAKVHSFNNVIQWRLYGIHVRDGGGPVEPQVLSENDVFDATFAHPGNEDDGVRFTDEGNAVRVVNPRLLNGAEAHSGNESQVFAAVEFYPYVLDPVDLVLSAVTSRAGPR